MEEQVYCITQTVCGRTKTTLTELILDERYAECFYIKKKWLMECGGWNRRITAKRQYELLLRLAELYPVCLCESAQELEADDGWIKIDAKEVCEMSSQISWKQELETDCYIAARYRQLLAEEKYFELVCESILECYRTYETMEDISEDKDISILRYMQEMFSCGETYRWIESGAKPVLIYCGDAICYGVLDDFAHQFGEALQRQDVPVIYYNSSEQGESSLGQLCGQYFRAIVGFQSYLFSIYLKAQGKYLHELIYGAKYNFEFDHPIWLRSQLDLRLPDYHVCTHDRNYQKFMDDYYTGLSDNYVIPPAGRYVEEQVPWEQRCYPLVFVGTYGDYRSILSVIHKSGSEIRHFVAAYLAYMRKYPQYSAEQALELLVEKRGMVLQKEEFLELFEQVKIASLCVSYYYREKVIRTILDAGIELHVFGESWKNSPFADRKNCVCHEDVHKKQVYDIYSHAKISMNIMTWHKDGFTERIAGSMLAGSMVLSDESRCLTEEFADGEELVLFQLTQLEGLPHMIKSLLEEENKMSRIAENGCKKAQKYHTWDCRAKDFIKIIR